MGKMTKSQLVENLTELSVAPDLASQYAGAFLEYQEAMDNIEKLGSVVTHPRTAAIMPNPYLKIRDGAERRLQAMRKLINIKIIEYIWKIWASKKS